jgi:hypothetical protein
MEVLRVAVKIGSPALQGYQIGADRTEPCVIPPSERGFLGSWGFLRLRLCETGDTELCIGSSPLTGVRIGFTPETAALCNI